MTPDDAGQHPTDQRRRRSAKNIPLPLVSVNHAALQSWGVPGSSSPRATGWDLYFPRPTGAGQVLRPVGSPRDTPAPSPRSAASGSTARGHRLRDEPEHPGPRSSPAGPGRSMPGPSARATAVSRSARAPAGPSERRRPPTSGPFSATFCRSHVSLSSLGRYRRLRSREHVRMPADQACRRGRWRRRRCRRLVRRLLGGSRAWNSTWSRSPRAPRAAARGHRSRSPR